MSENNKEKKLPDKDYFHSYQGDEDKKRKHAQITAKEKAEFENAFSDDEDVKTYVPQKKKVVKSAAAPVQATSPEQASQVKDELYALPDFNSDEFFASLGFGAKKTSDEADTKARTRTFDPGADQAAPQTTSQIPQKATQETVSFKAVSKQPAAPSEQALDSTRYFNVKNQKSQRPSSSRDKKKSFKQNFRVLSKDKEDRAILEAAPVGSGGKVFADSVKAEKGEGIFDAVEKAYEKESSQSFDAERELKAKRKKKLKEHRRKGQEKGNELKASLNKKIQLNTLSIYILSLIFSVSFVMTLFFTGTTVYPTVSLVLLLATCLINYKSFIRSFKELKELSASADTALVILCFFSLVHSLSSMLLLKTGSVYTLCAIFACLAENVCELYKNRGKLRFVSMAMKSKELSIMQGISVKTGSASLSEKPDENGEPNIFYCSDAYLDTAINEPAENDSSKTKYYIFSISAVLFACIVIGIMNFISEKTGFSFVVALTATACALLPMIYDPLSRFYFFSEGSPILKNGAAMSGLEALRQIKNAEGFVFDVSDVFTAEICRFKKSAISSISQSDSAVFAASVLSASNSLLAHCFDSFIEELGIKLPEPENLQYEEKQGFSAWVKDKKVLVGNRHMLLNHSIDVPSKEEEKAYGKGRFVCYVVIDGQITATFLVTYKVLPSLRRYSRDFNKTGLVLMISSKEPFITEQFAASKLSVETAGIKVLSSKATSIMDKYSTSRENQDSTGLICSKKKRAFMHLVMGSYNLESGDRLIRQLSVIGQITGLLLVLAALLLKIPVVLNPVVIILLRALWSGIIILILRFKNSKTSVKE